MSFKTIEGTATWSNSLFEICSRMYQNLTCNNEEYSQHRSPAMQQNSTYHETQGVSKSCDYKCICCARLHVGNPCSCNVSTTTISTQTEQDVPRGLNADWFWKRGTYEHSVLQVCVWFISVLHCISSTKFDKA